MNKHAWSLALVLVLGSSVANDNITEWLLVKREPAAAFQLPIPATVYEHSHHGELRGLKVINAVGDPVPLRLTLMEDEQQSSTAQITLPVFQINQSVQVPERSQQTRTTWAGDAQSYQVTTTETVKKYIQHQEKTASNQLLFDATDLRGGHLDHLLLDWQFDEPGNRVFTVWLEGSQDLLNWQTLKHQQKLVEVNTGSQVLLENTVPISGPAHGYYRMTFLQHPVPHLKKVTAVMTRKSHIKRPLQWREINTLATEVTPENTHRVTWDHGGHFPVEQVQVEFDYPNVFAEVVLFSRPNEKQSWRRLASDRIYHVGQGEVAIKKNQLTIASNTDRFWRMDISAPISSPWVHGVRLAWRGHWLEFLAQGKGPFKIQMHPGVLAPHPPPDWYHQIPQALRDQMFSDKIALQLPKFKPVAQNKEESPPVAWHQVVFWLVLAASLLFLFWMAKNLIKDSEK